MDLVTMSGPELHRIEVLSELLAVRCTEISVAGDSGVEHEADAPAADLVSR